MAINNAPVADDDVFTVTQGATTTSLRGSLRSGGGDGVDTDPDGDALGWAAVTASLGNAFFSNGEMGFVTIVGPPRFPNPVVTKATTMKTAAGGTVTIETDGDFIYQAPAGFSGTDWFDYRLVDEHFAVDTGRVTINVLPAAGANDMPVAADDTFTGREDQRITGNLLADNGNGADRDPDGGALTAQAQTAVTAAGGTVSIFANGDFVYTPRANFHGTDSFTYTVLDARGAKDTATVALVVTPVNDAPAARNDAFRTTPGKPISGNVLADNGNGADSDPDGDALHVVAATIATAAGGSVTLRDDGTFTYAPAATFAGTDSFTYSLVDEAGATSTGTVSLSVINRAPSPRADTFTAAFGRDITGNVLGNDTDPDGDALSVVAKSITTVNGGTVQLFANGDFIYKPAAAFVGPDSFSYTATDAFGASANALVTVNYTTPAGARMGTNAGETIAGSGANDTIFAFGGNDTVSAQAGNDTVSGGAGGDTLNGDAGDDALAGETGRDALNGGIGNDRLFGGADADKLNGGTGDDWLVGGAGLDELTGGAGVDIFVFDAPAGASADRVRDFTRGFDELAVQGSDYGLAAGALPDASYLALTTNAPDVDHGRFLYNAATSVLAWDADGRAATANVTVATLNSGPAPTVSDFLIL